ncbi:MAG: hypothetical protein FJY83_05175 [Candidatus Aminicenantes bacterium]|nr:hypothetical protein [Candidatus Aminicenantes bacterium]
MKNLTLKAAISAVVFAAALIGGTESPIQLSEKAMAHLRAPSGSMPDEIKREISAVLERQFRATVAAVTGSGAETEYNAVTTLAAMFGDRDSLMNRLEISSDIKIPSGREYPGIVSLYIKFYTNDKLSGNFRSSAESHQRKVKEAVERNERMRQSAAAANRPFQPVALSLGSYTAIPAPNARYGWTWGTDDGRMEITVRTLYDYGVTPDLIRSKAETLHAQLAGAGLYNFLRRLSASRDTVPPKTEPSVREPGDCGKGAALTRHLEALRTQHRNVQTLDGELEWLLNSESPDRRQVVEYGRKAERIAAEYHAVFRDFKKAETRRGLVEELDLLVETPLLLNEVVVKYQHLAQAPITPLKPEDLVRSRDERSRTIIKLARDHFASRLESEGLRDILTSESWEEAVEKTAGHARRKVEEFIDGETERIFGFGFHDVESARRALQLQLRREIRRQVAKLLINVTSNQIVIEIVAGPVIRWIERDLLPRLKEALRQKGNLPERVARSVETMEAARRALNALLCDAKMRDVRSRLASARGTIHASRFLDADLRRAYAVSELTKLVEAKDNLERTMSLAQRRFLLNKDDYEDDLVLIDEVIGALRDILKRSVPSGTDVRPPVERKPPVQKVDPPVRLRHEERAETATFASLSPALKVLRFYEAGLAGVADGHRDYRSTFSRADSRLIWWELNFEYPAPGRRIDFSVEAFYYGPDGREINRYANAFNFQPEWTGSQHTNGFGYRDRGGWLPGTYRVVLFVDGVKIAEGKFHIVE